MLLYSYIKNGDSFDQGRGISIRFLSEFNYKGTVESWIKRNSGFKLELSDFDWLIRANDVGYRDEPIEYPYFTPEQILDSVAKIENVFANNNSKWYDSVKKDFEKVKAFIEECKGSNLMLQALVD